MKQRKIIFDDSPYKIEELLNRKYVDWEIAESFYDMDTDFMLLIMEREVEQ